MYAVREIPPKDVRDNLSEYDPLTQTLLYSRDITTATGAEEFFKKEWCEIDPYQYRDMRKAAERIVSAIASGEKVGIYSDYDCDGIPSAAALYSALRAFNHTNIIYYVPNRNTDGFGLNSIGVQKMIDEGVSAVCILDCGTSDPEHIDTLRSAGIDTVIVDHHLPGERTPESFAMINPTLEEGIAEPYPCAAGLTYIFIQALIDTAANDSTAQSLSTKPQRGWEKWQLDVVSLATLSDMVPLYGINRQFVHYGLRVFRKSPRPGVQALCRLLKIDQQKITQDDLTFLIVPRINAASRMGEAQLAFDLLTTDNITEAMEIAKALTNLNNKRKTTVASMVREANKQAKNKQQDREVWVFGSREWKPSLVGLVAQKMCETHNKTVFVWGQGGDSTSPSVKGSCRSVRHNTFAMMQEASEMFTESGGHKQAGGFTLSDGAEIILEDKLNDVDALAEETQVNYSVDGECAIFRDWECVEDCGTICTLWNEKRNHLYRHPTMRYSENCSIWQTQ